MATRVGEVFSGWLARCRARRLEATGLGAGVGLAALLGAAPALAQTWEGAGRSGPSLAEIVAVDATGEDGWPFGAEDVAGDGLGTFQPPEQSIDIRTLYATASSTDLWARLYVSDQTGVGGNVTAFVFVDADAVLTTGGHAIGSELNDAFTTDSSDGGYDYVIAIRGNNGAIEDIWEWQVDHYEPLLPADVNQAEGEADAYDDPIRWGGDQHGYLQARVPLALLPPLTADCNARLYARTVNDTGTVGDGDLEVGEVGPCVAGDGNNDRVPDVVVPEIGCQSDADCPGNGICVAGRCVLAPPCRDDTDCGPNEVCVDGQCVAQGGEACDTDADCNGLVCVNGQCEPCTAPGVDCPTGFVCAPDGRCVAAQAPPGTGGSGGTGTGGTGPGPAGAGGLLGPGEEVRGGACACTVLRGPRGSLSAVLFGVLAALGLLRRRHSWRS